MSGVQVKQENNEKKTALPQLTSLLEEFKREDETSWNEGVLPDDEIQDHFKSKEKNHHTIDQSVLNKTQKRFTHTPQNSFNEKRKAVAVDEDSFISNENVQIKEKRLKLAQNDIELPEECAQTSQYKNKFCLNEILNNSEINIRDDKGQQQYNPTTNSFKGATVTELDLVKILKTEDNDLDEEPDQCNLDVHSTSIMQSIDATEVYIPMEACIYDSENNSSENITPCNYSFTYKIDQGNPFYSTSMNNIERTSSCYPKHFLADPSEVHCLPVINSAGFCGLPSFKRIKLEKNTEKSINANEDPVLTETKKEKVFATCTSLLRYIEDSEPKGKFLYISTVAKMKPNTISNSTVKKTFNFGYTFHSIGPKQNLLELGLREIGKYNSFIAKKIAISADKYFDKVEEKAKSVTGRLIKMEDDNAKVNQVEMDAKESTLSTFLRNCMTQTDPMACRECAVRQRNIGHDIAVQVKTKVHNISSQTSFIDHNDNILSGLNQNQIKAMYKFSNLIRVSLNHTSTEFLKLRESLMDIYNLSQRSNIDSTANTLSSHPFLSPMPSQTTDCNSYNGDPRTRVSIRSNFNPRRYSNSSHMPMHPLPDVNSFHQSYAMQRPSQSFPTYAQTTLTNSAYSLDQAHKMRNFSDHRGGGHQ